MLTLETDTYIFDDFRDISSGEKQIARVGTKTFQKKQVPILTEIV